MTRAIDSLVRSGNQCPVTSPEDLAPAPRLALAWQPAVTRPALAALFALDARLAGVVTAAKEPLLVQIRLAWWRERLAELGSGNSPPEPLLAALAGAWGSAARELAPLIDGWEARLCADSALGDLAEGRAQALAAYAHLAGAPKDAPAAAEAGRRWSRAEGAGADPAGRLAPLALSHRLRGVAVLGALATCALERGEGLLEGRGAVAAAWRVGLLGR